MNQNETQKPLWIFYGTDKDVSVTVLNVLKEEGFVPTLIVTVPDKEQGRKMELTPSSVKEWALAQSITLLQPEKLDANFLQTLKQNSDQSGPKQQFSFALTASYGLLIPKNILELPTHGTFNLHPSLLPKYRGATPAETAILADDKNTGVTIIKMDEGLDSGPIVATEQVSFEEWPTKPEVLRKLAEKGAEAFVKIIPNILDNTLKLEEQNESLATFCYKISKEDGLIDLNDDQRKNFLKTQAYAPWPSTFFFATDKKIRVKITEAKWQDNKFMITKVIPEGKKEMSYETFLASLN